MDKSVTCAGCEEETDRLAVFPGRLCLDCYARTPEANRPVSASELTAMWGGPVRRIKR